MFNFRIINTPEGNQIIDRNLSTPYNTLTIEEFQEYMRIDDSLYHFDILKRKRKKQMQKNKKWYRKIATLIFAV